MQEYIVRVDEDGTRKWYWNGQLHRVDGPAVEYHNGRREWYVNGQPHRTDGPAVEWDDGSCIWYVNGELHRVDGPAVEWADGDRYWYLNGQSLTELEFLDQTKPQNSQGCDGLVIEIDGRKYRLTAI